MSAAGLRRSSLPAGATGDFFAADETDGDTVRRRRRKKGHPSDAPAWGVVAAPRGVHALDDPRGGRPRASLRAVANAGVAFLRAVADRSRPGAFGLGGGGDGDGDDAAVRAAAAALAASARARGRPRRSSPSPRRRATGLTRRRCATSSARCARESGAAAPEAGPRRGEGGRGRGAFLAPARLSRAGAERGGGEARGEGADAPGGFTRL